MSELLERHRAVIAPVIGFDNDIQMVSGEGVWLTAADGKNYLDFACGISVVNAGHNHPDIVARARSQFDAFWHAGGTFRYETVVTAAEKIVAAAPEPLDMAFFMNSGAEAVEAGVKLARHTSGRPGILVFRGAFHGRTMGAVSYTTSSARYRAGYHPLLPGVYVSEFPHPFAWGLSPDAAADRALEQLRLKLKHEISPEHVACFLVEPVQGEGGYYPAPPQFLRALRELADDHGILLVIDEIQTGYGRTAEMWGVDHYTGVTPDIMLLGKAIANGLPLSAVVSTRDLFGKWPRGAHGTTFGGNPVACAAAAATVEVITGLLPNARKLADRAWERLPQLAERHPTIGEVRGIGLMIGIELVGEDRRPDAEALSFVRRHVLDNGMLFHPCGPDGNVIRFIPPLITTPDELDHGIDLVDAALDAYERR